MPVTAPTGGSCLCQRLVEIGDDVFDMLEADREADIAVGDAGLALLLGRELRMRGRRRMDRERARIADISDVVAHLQRLDEAAPRIASAVELEADECAITAAEIGVRPPLRGG